MRMCVCVRDKKLETIVILLVPRLILYILLIVMSVEEDKKKSELENLTLSDDDDSEGNINDKDEKNLREGDENEDPYGEEGGSSKNPTLVEEQEEEESTLNSGRNKPHPPPPVPPKDGDDDKGRSSGQKFVLSETGVEVYVSQHNVPKTKKLVILLTNSLGIASTNNMNLADLYSEKLDCPVIMPDLFDNDPIPTHGVFVDDEDEQGGEGDNSSQTVQQEETTSNDNEGSSPLLNIFKKRAAGAVKGFLDEMWMAKHTYERTYPTLAATVAEIVEVFKPSSVAVIGYSFGARYVLQLLEGHENNEWSSDEDLITVGASVHPSLLQARDFDPVVKPLYVVAAAEDEMLPDKTLNQGFETLRKNRVDFDNLTVTGDRLPHGFAVPGDYPESMVGDRPYQVIDKVVEWVRGRM